MPLTEILTYLSCPQCFSDLNFDANKLTCNRGHLFPIIKEIPHLLVMDSQEKGIIQTAELYGRLWKKNNYYAEKIAPDSWHFDKVQEVFPTSIVTGSIGVEVGCGSGYDTYLLAKKYPSVIFLSFDISEGVFTAKKLIQDLPNVFLFRASVLYIPIKTRSCDFVYSYGVLHHLPDPYRGFKEVVRILKPSAPFFLYLYEKHEDTFWKAKAVRVTGWMRKLTSNLSPETLEVLSIVLSPFIVMFFSWPARVLEKFRGTRSIAQKIPFNFGTGLFSIRGDLYDRFGAPYEYRFSKKDLIEWYQSTQCEDFFFGKMKESAGWVTSARTPKGKAALK